jgi:hypothetical protein
MPTLLSGLSKPVNLSVSLLLPLLAGCAVTFQATPANNASGIANPATVSVATNTTIANSAGTGAAASIPATIDGAAVTLNCNSAGSACTAAQTLSTGAHTLSVTAVVSQPAFYSIPTGTPTQGCSMPGGYFGTINECAKMTATSTFLVNCSKGPITVTNQFPLNVSNGQSVQLTASGGCPPYTWVVSGSLPPGISVSLSGLVSGTYTGGCPNEWTFDSTLQVSDPAGDSGSHSLSFYVC